jgi:hypothetical protein
MNQSSPDSIYDHSVGARHAVPASASNAAPASASNSVPASAFNAGPATQGEQNVPQHAAPASPSNPVPAPDSHSDPAPAPSPARCPHLYPSGRHCRKPVFDQHFGLCRKHFAASQKNHDVADLTSELVGGPDDLNNLEGLYDFLTSLLILLSQNRVSTRRASVLAFITSQLTRIDTAIHRRDADTPPQIIFDAPRPIRP